MMNKNNPYLHTNVNYGFFITILKQQLLTNVVPEYRFCPERKYRIDVALPVYKIAIEIEGGVYQTASIGHASIGGILRDMEKYNLLTELGWRVLRYTTDKLNKSATLEQIKNTINIVNNKKD